MSRIGLLIISILSVIGSGYLIINYVRDSSFSDPIIAHGAIEKSGAVASSAGFSNKISLKDLQKQIELDQSDRLLLDQLTGLTLGSELFWLIKINSLVEEYPEYQSIKEELIALLRSQSQAALESVEQALKGLPPQEHAAQKMRLLKLVDLCNGPPELVKRISWSILESEITPELDPKVQNSAKLNNRININVQLTAHALYLGVVDEIEGWEGTKTTMQLQLDPWVKSRLAQQYLKKWPARGESIRHELVSFLEEGHNRAPANAPEEEIIEE